MRRLIDLHGPFESYDAVCAVGRAYELDYQDYYHDKERTYSAILVIYDDAEFGECDVVEQVRTLLAERGADAQAFHLVGRYLSFPDALEGKWYEAMHVLGDALLRLEALGVRTVEEQMRVEALREKIRYEVAVASEVAEANVAAFTEKIGALLNLVHAPLPFSEPGSGLTACGLVGPVASRPEEVTCQGYCADRRST